MVHRVFLTIDDPDYDKLLPVAREKFLHARNPVLMLIRYSVIPDWLRMNGAAKKLTGKGGKK